MWYKVDFTKLILDLLPLKHQKAIEVNYVKALLKPISQLYTKWSTFRTNNLYQLAHNGQVCYLRKALNDKFDPVLRRIQIGNGNKFKRQYIYTRAEQKPKFLGTMYLHSRTDYADTGVDFIVYVPTELVNAQFYEIDALIQFYREGVKRYKIVKI